MAFSIEIVTCVCITESNDTQDYRLDMCKETTCVATSDNFFRLAYCVSSDEAWWVSAWTGAVWHSIDERIGDRHNILHICCGGCPRHMNIHEARQCTTRGSDSEIGDRSDKN